MSVNCCHLFHTWRAHGPSYYTVLFRKCLLQRNAHFHHLSFSTLSIVLCHSARLSNCRLLCSSHASTPSPNQNRLCLFYSPLSYFLIISIPPVLLLLPYISTHHSSLFPNISSHHSFPHQLASQYFPNLSIPNNYSYHVYHNHSPASHLSHPCPQLL